ncbi:5-hydroxytryptamine receptor 2A-like [Orbicella faveolata]|uniref:5-hydroxytryptamine receptor 2A-like n=1 Tax=Orbicella faveolata TaxID=48498 RepID=UPI0009E578F6|nr:5-hydroxytryptamine receptor 2A-like [Orbicella faveolata]
MNFTVFPSPSTLAPENFLSTPGEALHQQNKSDFKTPLCDQRLDEAFWVVNGIIGVVILLGNSFTCTVFLSSSYLRRNYMNIYLLSLGVADISMAVLVVPGFAAFCSGCTYKWSEYCWFFGGARDISFPATVLNVLAITYDRYTAVIRPLHYASTMTNRKVFTILVAVWVTPLVVWSLRNIWFHSWSEEAVKKADTVYNAVLITIFVFLPLPVLFIVNLQIMRAIKSHGSRIHADMVERMHLSFQSSTIVTVTEPSTREFGNELVSNADLNVQNRRNISRRRKGTLSCVLVVFIFIISWLPRAFLNFCYLFGRRDLTSPMLIKLSLFLLFFQSSVNPAIYCFLRNDFRQAAKRLIKWR